ncbi:hypothetical protein [Streptomyces sp. NPDC090083]|uniref:hypothetical protein n=1 Tax=Streptomyces sp. NPDC090083 TaxID=3365941 RepID=UPI003802F72B
MSGPPAPMNGVGLVGLVGLVNFVGLAEVAHEPAYRLVIDMMSGTETDVVVIAEALWGLAGAGV